MTESPKSDEVRGATEVGIVPTKPTTETKEEEEPDWTEVLYPVKILKDEKGEVIPQWGWMDKIEKPCKDEQESKYVAFHTAILFALLTTFVMVTMNAMSKYSMRFAAHPQQMGLFKTSIFAIIMYFTKPPNGKLSTVGLTKVSLAKRAVVMGTLALSQLFVSRMLPINITATLNSLSPLSNSLLAAIFLGEKINPLVDVPLLFCAGLGTLVCSKPPFMTGEGVQGAGSFTRLQYFAIAAALVQVMVRSGLMCFARSLRKKGANTSHFSEIMFYDSCCATLAMFLGVFANGKVTEVFTTAPSWPLLPILGVVAFLNCFKPYLATNGASNLDVSVASVLSCTNVLYSVMYSMYLFEDNSTDLFYCVGTALVVGSCGLKLYLTTSSDGGKKGQGKGPGGKGPGGKGPGGKGPRGKDGGKDVTAKKTE